MSEFHKQIILQRYIHTDSNMPVYYNSKKIIPAPKSKYSKNIQRAANGDILGAVFNISVIGVILSRYGFSKLMELGIHHQDILLMKA